MKVLFAVNNDEISSAIEKQYQKQYREIISYKNVYYFNAILKELQKDKSYDRVVISEDLEPFANNNYDTIDKFLFEKLDRISDEAIDEEGNHTDIVLICTDRRNKSDDMLVKLFGIGIYSAIVGQERSIEEVCRLINKPRTKKEAKIYYKIESDNVNYQSESEDSVNETEVQNILAHYKRLGKNEDKYVDSFNNIASQYTDTQLKIIIRYLPMNVKAVLEENSPKYQELVAGAPKVNEPKKQYNQYNQYKKTKEKPEKLEQPQEKIKVKMIENESNKITKPILVPVGMNKNEVKRLIKQEEPLKEMVEETQTEVIEKMENIVKIESEENINNEVEPKKRGRGRPRKNIIETVEEDDKPKRGRGRPRKEPIEEVKNNEEEIDLFDLNEEENSEEVDLFDLNENENENEIDLFDLDEDSNTEESINLDDENEDVNLFDLDEEESNDIEEEDEEVDLFDLEGQEEQGNANTETINPIRTSNELSDTKYRQVDLDFSSLITKDKKIVGFVGTTKAGTSFVVNNLAHMLASIGISTAVLDMTKTRNAYYIYTNSDEQLMQTAKNSINKLRSGIADGIKINKNLTIYTSVPEDDSDYSDINSIIGTLVKNYSVVLVDCDFDTPMEYFAAIQELYLVQSMDVLTIQPLTAFLRNLQSRGILKQENLRVVINKAVNIKSVPIKTLIGGISKYNDPSMSYQKDLFDKDRINYCVIPFELPNYIKYLDSLITCSITLNGYTKPFIAALRQLSNMVYPLINKQTYSPRGDKYKDSFSTEMNDTLNKMKRKYQ